MNVPARSVVVSAPTISIRNYAIVTAAYWAFTFEWMERRSQGIKRGNLMSRLPE